MMKVYHGCDLIRSINHRAWIVVDSQSLNIKNKKGNIHLEFTYRAETSYPYKFSSHKDKKGTVYTENDSVLHSL